MSPQQGNVYSLRRWNPGNCAINGSPAACGVVTPDLLRQSPYGDLRALGADRRKVAQPATRPR